MEKVKKMKVFNDLTKNEEEFNNFVQKQIKDDNNLREYLDNCNHKEFTFTILNLGTLLNTVATYFGFVKKQLDDAIVLNENLRNRKISKIVKDLNEKINDRYDFEKDTNVIESVVLYQGELYVYINKSKFIRTLEIKSIISL